MSIKVQEQVLENFFPTPDDTFIVSYHLFYANGGTSGKVEVTFKGDIDLYPTKEIVHLAELLKGFALPFIETKESLVQKLDKHYFKEHEVLIEIYEVEKIEPIQLM